MTLSQSWCQAIDEYLEHATAAGAPQTTRYTREQHLQHLARRVEAEPWALTGAELVTYAAAQTWAAETRRGRRSTFLSFYRWAIATGRTDTNPALSLPRVKAAMGKARPTPELVYREAVAAGDVRARLILRLAAEVGLRRSEIARIHSRDLMQDLVGWSLVVHGKGDRERIVPLPDGLARVLRALPSGFAFPGDDGGHLSPRWVGKIATRLLPGDFTLHTLRHRFATLAYQVDRDVFVVQELLGHSSPATTRRYVQTQHEHLRRTVVAVAD
jgi:integrase